MLSDQQTIFMVEDLVGRAQTAMINFLNEAAAEIHHRANVEVPKSEAHEPRTGHPTYPAESLEERSYTVDATPDSLHAFVVYPGPYAAAQEAGVMQYERASKEVEWVAEHYTTAGTKSHYLEDAGKSVMGALPEELAIQGHIAMGDLPGLRASRQSLRSTGQRELRSLPPTGTEAQIMAREQQAANVAAPTSLTRVRGSGRLITE